MNFRRIAAYVGWLVLVPSLVGAAFALLIAATASAPATAKLFVSATGVCAMIATYILIFARLSIVQREAPWRHAVSAAAALWLVLLPLMPLAFDKPGQTSVLYALFLVFGIVVGVPLGTWWQTLGPLPTDGATQPNQRLQAPAGADVGEGPASTSARRA